MNVLLFALLLFAESLAQQSDEDFNERTTLKSTGILRHASSVSDAVEARMICLHCLREHPECRNSENCDACRPSCTEYADPLTTEDPTIVSARRACEQCLREHRECKKLLDCTVCYEPCDRFKEYALPTFRTTTVNLEANDCERCLQNHPICNNSTKCDTCKATCASQKDIQASLRAASRCKICKDTPRCRKYGKCDLCKKYCERDDDKVATTTVASVKPLETTTAEKEHLSSHILNLTSSRRKAGIGRLSLRTKPVVLHEIERDIHEKSDDVVGAATPLDEINDPNIVSPVVGSARDMKGLSLSQTAPRYYPIGAFGPGARMNHILHMLNIHRSDDIEKIIVIAKLKSPVTVGNEPPVIIDYSKLFTNVDVQSGPGNRIPGPSIDLTSEIDKELEMAGVQKKVSKGESSLTPDEVFKIIQHAVSLHKMREDGPISTIDETPSVPTLLDETTTPFALETDSNVIPQNLPIPMRNSLLEKLPKPLATKKSQEFLDVEEEEEKRTVSEETDLKQRSEPEDTSFVEEILPQMKPDDDKIVSQEPLQDLEEESVMDSRNRGVESSSLVQETSSITPLEVKMQKVLEEAERIATTEEAFAEVITSTFKPSSMDENVRSSETDEEPIMGSRNRDMELQLPTTESSTQVASVEEQQTESDMLEKLRKTIDDRKKKLEDATIVGKQRIQGALGKLKEMIHKEKTSEEEGVVGIEQETTTTQAETTTIKMDLQDKKNLVEKFTGVIAHDLTGSHNLTEARKAEIEEEISKLVESTIDTTSPQRANEELDNLDEDLTKIERLVESADEEKQQETVPSKGAVYTDNDQVKEMDTKKPSKTDEVVGQPFVIEAEEFNAIGSTITTPKKIVVTEKPAQLVTQSNFAKALVEDVTDVPEYIMQKMQKLIGKVPSHRFKLIPEDRSAEDASEAESEATLGQSQESSSSSSEAQTQPTEINWGIYRTSTVAPYEFPKYEGTTLSVSHGWQSDTQVGQSRSDWTATNEPRDSFESFNTFGKIVPAKDTSSVVHHKFPSDEQMVKDAYFYGDMELPLRMKYYSDGTIKLAVDKKKYCQCSDNHCSVQDGDAPGADVMQLDEGNNWKRKNEDDDSFEDVALGMSAPDLSNRNIGEEQRRGEDETIVGDGIPEDIATPPSPSRNVNANEMTTQNYNIEDATFNSPDESGRNEAITSRQNANFGEVSNSDIEPINEKMKRKQNQQAKRESAHMKKLKERKNKLMAKLEKRKLVYKRSPLMLKMLGSGEHICPGGDCEESSESTQTKRHLDNQDVVHQRVGLVTDLLSWMKNLAVDKKN